MCGGVILKDCVAPRIFQNALNYSNPDIRELSGPAKYLISGFLFISSFGLFCLGNTGSNLGPRENLSYIRVSYILVTLYI